MPCHDPSTDRERHANARRLCGMCTVLEATGLDALIDEVPSLREWWTAHKAWDEWRRSGYAKDKHPPRGTPHITSPEEDIDPPSQERVNELRQQLGIARLGEEDAT